MREQVAQGPTFVGLLVTFCGNDNSSHAHEPRQPGLLLGSSLLSTYKVVSADPLGLDPPGTAIVMDTQHPSG